MEPQSPNVSIAARLTRLEQRNRVQRIAIAALAGALILPAFTTRDGDEARARRFVLVDAKGATAGVWETDADGRPSLELFDGSPKARLSAQVQPDDVLIALRDRAGFVRAGLAAGVGGLPHLLLSDAKGRPRVHLSVNQSDLGNVVVFGPEGGATAGLGVLEGGKPWLRPLPDQNGQPTAAPPTADPPRPGTSTRRGG